MTGDLFEEFKHKFILEKDEAKASNWLKKKKYADIETLLEDFNFKHCREKATPLRDELRARRLHTTLVVGVIGALIGAALVRLFGLD